jgi:hypothetical protein
MCHGGAIAVAGENLNLSNVTSTEQGLKVTETTGTKSESTGTLPMNHWHPFSPADVTPWNITRVIHLHRRTVFGATIAEQERDLADDPQTAVTRILTGSVRIDTPADFDDLSDVIGDAAVDSPNSDR